MANLLYNNYKSSKKYYKRNLLLTLSTFVYSSMLLYRVKIISYKYLVCVILDVILYCFMFIYILYEYRKAIICLNKALYGYKSFIYESFTSC